MEPRIVGEERLARCNEHLAHYNQRGIASIRKNDAKSAYSDFVQATKLDEGEAAFFGNRGFAGRRLGLYRDAANAYRARAVSPPLASVGPPRTRPTPNVPS